MFQLTAARRRLANLLTFNGSHRRKFQLTAARRRLGLARRSIGRTFFCFNSQPPEGGWIYCFAAWVHQTVSTHSRPKAAGGVPLPINQRAEVSTHSRPKAAGRITAAGRHLYIPFQLTAARRRLVYEGQEHYCIDVFQLTAARRRLAGRYRANRHVIAFQLTAARRRLAGRLC